MGFAQGVSGINAAASNLDVIGNNIANSGTIGFKAGGVQFADVYAGSKIGLGTSVAAVTQNFNQGSVQTSSRTLDIAIVDGNGFFRLASPGGEVAYTRNGQFDKDKDGYIVTTDGMRLTGYQVGANGALAGGMPAALQIPTTEMQPSATSRVVAQFNIDSRSAVPAQTPFDPANSSTYNYPNAVTVYDSLGNPHEFATFFVKTGTNSWDVYGTVDGTIMPAVVPPAAPAPLGSLGFDTAGQMVLVPPATGTFATTVALTNGAAPLALTLDLNGTTQFGNSNDVRALTQDGYTSGSLVGFEVADDGRLIGKYANEQTALLGQVVLSTFVNPGGLVSQGGNNWVESAASGAPLTGAPGKGSKLGALVSGALESSNVDLTAELVNLIVRAAHLPGQHADGEDPGPGGPGPHQHALRLAVDRMIYVGMGGARHAMEQQAAVAHNMANVATPGFRAQINSFRAVPVRGDELPTRAHVVAATVGADFAAGPVTQTGRGLDVAIRGDGWLAVQAADGSEAYTRAGSLQLGVAGEVLTHEGRPVIGDAGPLAVPPGSEVAIGSDGLVTARAPGAAASETAGVGRLKLVKPREADLERGDDGLFRLRAGLPPAQPDATVTVLSGAVEGSNVNPAEALVQMISSARQFEMQMKTVQTAENDDQAANRLLSTGG
jgi:flagellar hook protein FlgE